MDKSIAWSRHPDSLGQAFLWAFLSSLALFLIAPSVGNTQAPVVTDITSSGLGTAVPDPNLPPPPNGVYNITGGTRPGDGPNLFHSFGEFSIGQGDIANFLNDSGLTTSNIIGRVTGGNMSNIDGIVQTTGFGTANLFLVNPTGIVFGPNGSFDVGGSVSFSTAQYLRLFDGDNSANFYANPANDGLANSVFAMAPVVAFGFLSPAAYGFLTAPDPSATITVLGSALSVLPDQSISFVGGDISIQQAAYVSAPGGHINLVSVASPGEVLVPSFQTGPNINGASFTTMGTVTLKEDATLDVSGQFDEFGNLIGNGNSGTVLVRGGQLVMNASFILANTVGAVDGARTAVDIQVSHDVALSNVALISVGTSSSGRGGDVVIAAGNVHLDTASTILTKTSGPGRGGDVHITADSLTLENASEMNTKTEFGDGVGGYLSLNVGTLALTGSSVIRSHNFNFGTDLDGDGVPDVTGVGGDVTVRGTQGAGSAADSVVVSGGSQIVSETLVSGDGGQVSIATKFLALSGRDTNGVASSIKSSTFGIGGGGDIVLSVQEARVLDGATIASETRFDDGSGIPVAGESEGGNITVQGLDGDGSKADSLTLNAFPSGIVSGSNGLGRPGGIEVYANSVSLTEGAVIVAGSQQGDGTGGIVTITAGSVAIVGGSRISSQARTLAAGTVTITADRLTLDNGSIETTTISETGGRGGDVELTVGSLSLANGATINSSTSQTGRAGDITMNVGTLSLATGSSISSASTGTDAITNPNDGTTQAPGTAGNVVITATGRFTSDASTIATSAEANHGGDVSITAQSVQLSNGTLITANSNAPFQVKETVLIDGQLVEQVVGNGNAGNITVRSGSTFVMTNSSMTTEASRASGGQIEIITPEMFRLINGRVSTSVAGSANDTAGGNITIDPQFVVLQGGQIVAKAFAGSGGAIDIIATSAFIQDPASIVDASSTLGISGTINIQSPLQNIGGELAPLSDEFSSAAALLAQQCAARAAGGKFSTFVVAAREGLPAEPGGFLASPSLTAESLGSRLSGRDSYRPIAAVTGAFPEYEARPIQLAKLGNACHQ